MKKKILILSVAFILFYGCARPLTRRESIPPPPSAQAIWIYGHYDSQDKWIPGRWVE
ncbi:MAG: YXWGXW repeat-containing protein [Deltaproteobacteria bacterium]|nr:YXWGXW repeat-containing protein [Deltaproteobacteria bacterium]